MATPLGADAMVSALKNEGVKVSEYYSGWRTHNRNSKGPWGGVNGVVIHHTAGTNSRSLCYYGRSDLPGPLCHAHLAKDGTVMMIGNGRANHAGMFTQNAHDAVVNESSVHPRPSGAEVVDGNAHYYGLEIENLGNGTDPYPDTQYKAAVKYAAAICRAHGWSHNSVIGHKEGTTRKIDPSFDMNKFRSDVATQLKPAPAPAPAPAPSEELDMAKYVSLARVGNVTLKPGVWTKIYWDTEHADETGYFAVGHSGILSGKSYIAAVNAVVSGLPTGTEFQIRAVEVDSTGTVVQKHPISESVGTADNTYASATVVGKCSPTRKLCIQVAQWSTSTVVVERADIKAWVW